MPQPCPTTSADQAKLKSLAREGAAGRAVQQRRGVCGTRGLLRDHFAHVRELVEVAFAHVGLDWRKHVITDPTLTRPAEVDFLVGDASKAHRELGWRPEVSFKELIERMVDADLGRNRKRDG